MKLRREQTKKQLYQAGKQVGIHRKRHADSAFSQSMTWACEIVDRVLWQIIFYVCQATNWPCHFWLILLRGIFSPVWQVASNKTHTGGLNNIARPISWDWHSKQGYPRFTSIFSSLQALPQHNLARLFLPCSWFAIHSNAGAGKRGRRDLNTSISVSSIFFLVLPCNVFHTGLLHRTLPDPDVDRP